MSKEHTSRVRLVFERLEQRSLLAVFHVTNLDDAPVGTAGDAPGTLRQAVYDSNELPGADEIVFADGLAGTIGLARVLQISGSVTINGPGADLVDLVGGRILVRNGASDAAVVSLVGLTIRTGGSVCCPACDCARAYGAAIESYESLSLVDSVLTRGGGLIVYGDTLVRNSLITDLVWERAGIVGYDDFDEAELAIEDSEISSIYGGGIDVVGGSIRIERSTISDNRTNYDGGGISCRNCILTVRQSSIENNEAGPRSTTPQGGGIYLFVGSLFLEDSTLAGNQAHDRGGGISAFASELVITNSTISGNTSTFMGGGVYLGRINTNNNLEINNSTIANNNTAALARRTGGGLAIQGGVVRIQNSIVSGNDQRRTREPAAPDIRVDEAVELNITNSLIGHRSDTGLAETLTPDQDGNLVGGPLNGILDAMLRPLENNGGPTRTHALLPGSPAVNAGDPNFVGLSTYDQRGAPFRRVSADRIDMGAFEYQIAPVDFNDDGQLGCADVDSLMTAIVAGNNPAEFDLSGDELVDQADLNVWLALAGLENLPSHEAYPLGDANLDGRVDAADLNVVGTNWLQDVTGWCSGDVSPDGIVNASDLNKLGLDWLQGVTGQAVANQQRAPRAPLAELIIEGIINALRDSTVPVSAPETTLSTGDMIVPFGIDGASAGHFAKRYVRRDLRSPTARMTLLVNANDYSQENGQERLVDLVLRRW